MPHPARLVVVLLLALLSLASLARSCSAMSPFTELRLLHARQAQLAQSTSLLSSASLHAAMPQLDCLVTAGWSTNLTIIGLWGTAPVSRCTLLVVVSVRPDWDNVLMAIDLRDGSTQWSLQVSNGGSILASPAAVQVSHSLTRVYLSWRNFTAGCTFSCGAVSAVDFSGEQPQLLWNMVLDEGSHRLQPLMSAGADSEEVLVIFPDQLASGGSDWLSVESATGRLLSNSSYGKQGLSLLGDTRDGRVLTTGGGSVTAYELQADGSWTVVGVTAWDGQSESIVFQSPFFPSYGRVPQLSPLLVLQNATQPDQWRAVDVTTGSTVWQMSGYAIFTGGWVQQAGCRLDKRVDASIHPLNASWAIVSARAVNGSNALLFQHVVLDLSTGQQVGASPANATVQATSSYSSNFWWYAASGYVATYVDADSSHYLAYQPTGLQLVSEGVLSTNPLHELEARFAGIDEKGATLLSRPQELVARYYPADDTAATRRLEGAVRHARE